MSSICLHRGPGGGIRGACFYRTCLVRAHIGGAIFAPTLWHLQIFYPEAYSRAPTSTLGLYGSDYEMVIEVEEKAHTDNILFGRVPKRR